MIFVPGSCSKSCNQNRRQLSDKFEGQFSSEYEEQYGQSNETVQDESQHNGCKVKTQLSDELREALHFDHFRNDQKENTQWRQPEEHQKKCMKKKQNSGEIYQMIQPVTIMEISPRLWKKRRNGRPRSPSLPTATPKITAKVTRPITFVGDT